jgi:hypothetical protein
MTKVTDATRGDGVRFIDPMAEASPHRPPE